MSETDSMSDSEFAQFLQDHPRMIGVLSGVLLFLTQVGSVAAANHGTIG